MTFSLLIATPTATAVLTASHYPAVGRIVPAARPGVAAVSQGVGVPGLAAEMAALAGDAPSRVEWALDQIGIPAMRQLAVAAAGAGQSSASVTTGTDILGHTVSVCDYGEQGAKAAVGNCLTAAAAAEAWRFVDVALPDDPHGAAVALCAAARRVARAGGDRRGPMSGALVVADVSSIVAEVRIDALTGGPALTDLLLCSAEQQMAYATVFASRPPNWQKMHGAPGELRGLAALATHGPDRGRLLSAVPGMSSELADHLVAVAASQWWRSLQTGTQ